MRHLVFMALCLSGTAFLAGCQGNKDAQVERAMKDVNLIDESNLNEVMLTVGEPNEAVSYFQSALEKDPGRIDLMRGLGKSLVRAGKSNEAAAIWEKVVTTPGSDPGRDGPARFQRGALRRHCA